jgi:hypothetical protein
MPASSAPILILILGSCFLIPSSCAAEQPRDQQNAGQDSADAPGPRQSSESQAGQSQAAQIPAPPNHPVPQPPPTHAFWDRTNILLFTGVGVFRGLDYASTRNFQARGREEVLIPDDVVNNSAGFAALEAAGTAASVGLSYWMHRVGHHKIERWISIVHIGITGFGVVRNYSLESKHTVP